MIHGSVHLETLLEFAIVAVDLEVGAAQDWK